MFRPYLFIVSIGLLFSPMLDATIKGTGVLLLAAAACLALRRDSAATRHMVWATAVMLVLAMPLLSILLPKWRVLPNWSQASREVAISSRSGLERIAETQPAPQSIQSPHVQNSVTGGPPQIAQPRLEVPPKVQLPPASPAEADFKGVQFNTAEAPLATIADQLVALLTTVWLVGCGLIFLRLPIAFVLLRKSAGRCRTLAPVCEDRACSEQNVSGPTGRCAAERALRAAMDGAAVRLGIRRSIQLLLDPQPSMPVVWGLLRPRMRLPAESLDWSAEQQQSVLLHELAHIRRNDLAILTLTQIATALNWFNPLMWIAAWRLHVERERACDDLVIGAGVRPSIYAGHLVEVVSRLRPVAWTRSCGLAMARHSSLEHRLAAVLSRQINHRGLTRVLVTAVLALGTLAAIPIAMLHAIESENTKEVAGRTAAPLPPKTHEPAVMKPKHEYAKSLFEKWRARARTDGKIPGALIGHLAKEVDGFLKQYPAHKESPKLAALRPRLDSSHDWAQADVVALLDGITDISTAPVSWTDVPMEFDEMRMLQRGKPLPAELASAAWGQPRANGLRAAWLLEPRADRYPLGSVLKTRVLFHNAGKAPIVFSTAAWHQEDKHTARDAKGREITVTATWYSGVTPTATYRLAPGEYCEVRGHGLAIGAGEYTEEHSTGAVGAVIQAKEGDDVALSQSVEAGQGGGWTKPDDPKDPAELWKKVIADRVANEAPMPQSAADREQLIRRLTLDLVGETARAEDVAAFAADNAPGALARLTARLQERPRIEPWMGSLTTGETKFRVTAADPNAAKVPRSANSPGRYVLADHVHLLVSQISTDDQRTNKAVIAFFSPDPKVASPHKPYAIALPDGLDSYGIVWQRGAGVLWVLQKDIVRKYDFTNPALVKETRTEPGSILDVPEQLRDTMRKAVNLSSGPVEQQNSQAPKVGTKLSPGIEEKLMPKHKDAQPLFKQWSASARGDGKIPGALIGQLAESVTTFTKNNPTWATTPQLLKMLPRLDATHDWSGKDALDLLDELAAVESTPIVMVSDNEWERTVRTGRPLPPELANAPWGAALPNGLRLAWLLEPRAAEHRLGTALKARILIHNAGKEPVVFRTRTWHQCGHNASDSKGAEIQEESVSWMTIGRLVPFRLAPGEFVEVNTPGIGVGASKYFVDSQNDGVGTWVEAKAGDEVTLTTEPVPLYDWNEKPQAGREPRWWLDFITARLARERPLPSDAAERTRLLYHVAMDLFGTPLGAEDRAAFIADQGPGALDSLAKRLAHHAGLTPYSGSLTSGPTKFRVLPPDPDAAKRPRTASNPGHYTLAENAVLAVTRRPVGERIVNEATIQFFSPDSGKALTGGSHEVKLPDGYDTWAAAWVRGGKELWLQEKSGLRRYDFSDPAKVKEEAAEPDKVPAEIREALRGAIPVPKPAPKRDVNGPPASGGT